MVELTQLINRINEDLKIGLEFHGIQHIKFTPYFHKNEQKFKDQVLRDAIKGRLCKEHGVKLIIIYHYEIENGDDILDSEILKIVLEKMAKLI